VSRTVSWKNESMRAVGAGIVFLCGTLDWRERRVRLSLLVR
jgi:hypothetical protein